MCGICGLIIDRPQQHNQRENRQVVENMCETVEHRGPDDWGIEVLEAPDSAGGARAILGQRRLSIIDIAGGHQPMCNETGDVWTVYNGEIYNHIDLRSDLQGRGHEFRTKCDTECLLHLYEDYGSECVTELRGMFSFALWDNREATLTLARDRMGQKPLYYFHDDDKGVFAFASELKALLQVPQHKSRISDDAIQKYLTYQYVPHPSCIFEGVKKLQPAHTLQLNCKSQKLAEKRYWKPRFQIDRHRARASFKEELSTVLREATEMRMMSDVPLGAFLSGGVDSSVTVALMSQLANQSVQTFSIGFENPRYDETSEARMVARHCQTNHTQKTIRPRALELLPALVKQYDEPFADSSAIPTYYVSQLAAESVKVVLTGDAGDECFAGYSRYAAMRVGQIFDRLPKYIKNVLAHDLLQNLPGTGSTKNVCHRLRRFMRGLGSDPISRYLDWMSIFQPDQQRRLLAPDFAGRIAGCDSSGFLRQYFNEVCADDWGERATYVDLMTYLPCDLLTKVDLASMAHGLETRSPFLDHRVVELAGRIPMRYKLRPTTRGLEGKLILKETFSDLLPRPILRRPKMGFGVPIADWFRNELQDVAHDILLSQRARERGYFRMGTVQDLICEHQKGQEDHAHRLWALLMLELWHRQFIDDGPLGL